MYDIVFSDKAKKQLNNLSQDLKDRIGRVFERIRVRPFHFVKRKQSTPYFILRTGYYRVILRITEKIIFVVELGHRQNIYKI